MHKESNKNGNQKGELNMTATAKAQKTAPSFMDTIAKSAKTKTTSKAKKVDNSILTNAPDNVKADIDAIIKAKKAMKKAKSEVTVAEKSIIDFGQNHKDKMARAGSFKKSYKIQGNGDDTVTFVTANKFSFNTDDVEDIKEILGDAADEMMHSRYDVKVKADVFTDEEKQAELMELLGDRFADFFETTVSYKVSDDFDSRIYRELNESKMDDLKVYVKQAKASVRG